MDSGRVESLWIAPSPHGAHVVQPTHQEPVYHIHIGCYRAQINEKFSKFLPVKYWQKSVDIHWMMGMVISTDWKELKYTLRGTHSAAANASRSAMPLGCAVCFWATLESPSPHYALKPTLNPENTHTHK